MAYVFRFQPEPTVGNLTMETLYGIQSEEMSKGMDSILSIFNENFIRNCDERGIENFEKLYGIKPGDRSTLEERRAIVYSKMIFKPPFTRQRLEMIFDNLLGKNNYAYKIYRTDYSILISISAITVDVYDKIVKDLREIIPANMTLVLSTKYTHIYLTRYTYGDLSQFTYGDLSEYSAIATTKYAVYLMESEDGELCQLEGAGVAWVYN